MVRILSLLLLVATAACACPTTDSGVAVSPTKYSAERDAACAAVKGCDLEAMSAVRVFEASTKAEVQRLCDNDKAYACFCPSFGCSVIFLLSADGRRDSNALHEHVHAALDVVGIDSPNHGPVFEQALNRARALRRFAR